MQAYRKAAGPDGGPDGGDDAVEKLQRLVEKIYVFAQVVKPHNLPPAPVLGAKFSYVGVSFVFLCFVFFVIVLAFFC
jgi:hypothetical protein